MVVDGGQFFVMVCRPEETLTERGTPVPAWTANVGGLCADAYERVLLISKTTHEETSAGLR